MALALVASYFVSSGANNTNTITTPSFTPTNGEVIVVKLATSDTTISMGTPTGGSQTYTPRVTVAPGGFRGWCSISTAVIAGSPGAMTISSTPSGVVRHSMVVERWSGAQLAVTPATGSANGATGAANATLTSTGTASIVAWVASDVQSLNPSTRAYLASATEDGLDDAHVSADGVHYYAYQSAAAPDTQTFGLSAPSGMQYVIAGIEVQATTGGSTINGTASIAGAGAVTALVTMNGKASIASTGTLTAAGVIAGTAGLTGVGTATSTVRQLAGMSLTGAGNVIASAGGLIMGSAALIGVGVVDINLNPCVVSRPNTGTTTFSTAITVKPDTGVTTDPC